jgi:hypothetical protein
MSFETDIIWHLNQDATLKGLVNERIFPETGDQDGPYPLIIWENLFGNYEATFDGPSSLKQDDLRFTVWARTKLETLTIRDRVISLLHGFKSASLGPSNTFIQGIFYQPGSSSFDGVMKLHYIDLDFTVYHS